MEVRTNAAAASDALPEFELDAAEARVTATPIARAALVGVELVRLADGIFITSRWGMFCNFDNIAPVEAWLRRVSGMTK
jgi:hypothetical protein